MIYSFLPALRKNSAFQSQLDQCKQEELVALESRYLVALSIYLIILERLRSPLHPRSTSQNHKLFCCVTLVQEILIDLMSDNSPNLHSPKLLDHFQAEEEKSQEKHKILEFSQFSSIHFQRKPEDTRPGDILFYLWCYLTKILLIIHFNSTYPYI